MIRAIRHHGEYARGEESRQLVRATSVTYFVSLGSCEIGTEEDFGSVDLPAIAFSSHVVVHLPTASSIVQFSTEDATALERRDHDEDDELQLLDDTRAYLASLVQGMQPGSRFSQAWEQFFLVYSRRIRQVVRQRGLSPNDAEDCVQEVWLVILEVLRRCGHERPWDRFSCWMQGLIQNQVANYVGRMTRPLVLKADPLIGQSAPVSHFDPVAHFERNERREMVRHVLGQLEQQVSPTNYRLVHLRWMEGCEIPEVAARLNLTSEQVRYRHYRVKKRVRRLLETHDVCLG